MDYPLPNKIGSGPGPQGAGKPVTRTTTTSTFTNIVGTQGYTGRQGSSGPQGSLGTGGHLNISVGSFGPQGGQGYQGFQGVQGEGDQGPIGDLGIIGDAGNQGSQGGQGIQGWQSANSFGLQGIQGETGGSQGSQGAQGTGWQGAQGNQAEAGVQGLQGQQGDGIQGFDGRASNIGNQGSQGLTGLSPQGPQGIQGQQAPSPGTVGYQGYQGLQGLRNRPNTAGPQGYQGIQGIIPVTTLYFYDDFAGSTYDGTYHTNGTISMVANGPYGIVKLTAAASNSAYLARGGSSGLINTYDTSKAGSEFKVNLAVYGASLSGIKLIVGLVNTITGQDEGVFFSAVSGTNSSRWQCYNRVYGGLFDLTNLSETPSFTDGVTFTFQELQIKRIASGYEYYINQSLKATHTSFFSTENLSPVIYIENLSASGTRVCYSDYFFVQGVKA